LISRMPKKGGSKHCGGGLQGKVSFLAEANTWLGRGGSKKRKRGDRWAVVQSRDNHKGTGKHRRQPYGQKRTNLGKGVCRDWQNGFSQRGGGRELT